MTIADLLILVRRRWYVYTVLVGAALVTILLLHSVPRTYTAESEVTFAPPAEVSATTEYNSYAETMINYAGAVDRSYNAEYAATQLSTPYATLFGNNERLGISVGISNVGNQWTNGFDRPIIIIDVNASSEKIALERLYQAVRDIETSSAKLQEAAGVPVPQRITLQWDDQEVVVGSFGNTRESLAKGTIALMGAALVFSTLMARCMDHFSLRLKRPAPRVDSETSPMPSPVGTGYPICRARQKAAVEA